MYKNRTTFHFFSLTNHSTCPLIFKHGIFFFNPIKINPSNVKKIFCGICINN